MKKLLILIGMVSMIAACGGGDSSGGDAVDQAETSFDDFVEQLIICVQDIGPFTGASVDTTNNVDFTKSTVVTCDCEGGGTVVSTVSDDLQSVTLVANSCTTASGNVYTGNLSSTDGGNTINGDMSQFGECYNGTATNVNGQDCSGSLSLQCPAGAVNCNVIDSSDPDECDLSC